MAKRQIPNDELPESLAVSLTRASRRLAADIEAALKPDGLAIDHWLVLEALARERGLTMADLIVRTGANGATLTRIVDRLVSVAAVYREVDAVDRRKVRVYLSTRGRALHRRLASVVREHERIFLEGNHLPEAAFVRR
jgi:DNA-binding MarR family transcriptional regulator